MIIKNTIYGDKTGLLDPKFKARLDPNHLYSEKNIEHPVTLDNLDFKSMRGGYPEIKTDTETETKSNFDNIEPYNIETFESYSNYNDLFNN